MAELPKYSRAEVAAHNTPFDLWIIINDKVYDLTEFQKEHPGGGDVLVDVAGKDATREFDDIGHSTDAKAQMKSYLVGELTKNESESPGTNSKRCKKILCLTGSAVVVGIGAFIIVKALQIRKNI